MFVIAGGKGGAGSVKEWMEVWNEEMLDMGLHCRRYGALRVALMLCKVVGVGLWYRDDLMLLASLPGRYLILEDARPVGDMGASVSVEG
jgi:hypothetical protein